MTKTNVITVDFRRSGCGVGEWDIASDLRFDPYLIEEPAFTMEELERARAIHPSSRRSLRTA